MSFVFASFTFALLQAVGIYDRVMARDGLVLRPQFVSKAIAARLRVGVRALEAYLRRVLILMALEMEHDLVVEHQPENLARAKAKKVRVRTYCLRIYPTDTNVGPTYFEREWLQNRYGFVPPKNATTPPITLPIGHWLDRLDHLHAIAKDPRTKARRLAYTLARRRHGILMAPHEHPRRLTRWGLEACALYDAMGFQIIIKSRSRPPPLPPPRSGPKPTITAFW